jgi:hypothetical protein
MTKLLGELGAAVGRICKDPHTEIALLLALVRLIMALIQRRQRGSRTWVVDSSASEPGVEQMQPTRRHETLSGREKVAVLERRVIGREGFVLETPRGYRVRGLLLEELALVLRAIE